MATAVFFHAHPDDEAIATGGTMARMAAEGHRVVLITATRGELGEVPDGYPRAGPDPGRAAGRGVGRRLRRARGGPPRVPRLRRLGMVGEQTNDDPGCFWQADVEEAAVRLAGILRSEKADVLTAYDENGNYGHPDHIQVHRVGLRAGELAGVPRVFMATVNRDHLLALMETRRRCRPHGRPGRAARRSTTWVCRGPHHHGGRRDRRSSTKRRAMQAHASQISETSFFLSIPARCLRRRLGSPSGTYGSEQKRTRPFETSLLGPETA